MPISKDDPIYERKSAKSKSQNQVSAVPAKRTHAAARKAVMDTCTKIQAVVRSAKPGVFDSSRENLRTKPIDDIRQHKAYVEFIRDKSLTDAAKVELLFEWVYYRRPTKTEQDVTTKFIRVTAAAATSA